MLYVDNRFYNNKRMQQTSTKGTQDQAWLVWKGDILGIVQESEIWPNYEMVYA